MVEVFKTNVEDKSAADEIKTELLQIYPTGVIDFDLEDCDKILRVENDLFVVKCISDILLQRGFTCEVLE